MKRFTETTKWSDPWFRRLSPAAKLLWSWLSDNCDSAGVIEPDMELATFQAGVPMGDDTLSELGERIQKLECGKLWIRGFIPFQVGKPSAECKAHKPIFQSIQKHNLERVFNGYPDGIDTVQEKDKEKEKDSGMGVQGEGVAPPTEAEVLAYAINASMVITPSCALRWITDRETADWTYPKGLHMLPVLPNWQANLRGYALDWNKREQERQHKEKNNANQTHQHRATGSLNSPGRYK